MDNTFLIADLAFSVSSANPLRIPESLGLYGEFMGGSVAVPSCAQRIPMRLVTDSAPDLSEWKTVFDADAWQVRMCDGRTLITAVNPADPHRPTTFAGLPDVDPLTVYQTCEPGSTDYADSAYTMCPLRHPLDKALMMHLLPRFSGFMVHAAGMVRGDRGVVCAGVSGAGKSTLSAVAEAAGWELLTDERPIVRVTDGEHRVYGTPWPGDGGYARNASAPLDAMVFLTQAPDNAAVPLDSMSTIRRLMPVVSMPMYDPDLVASYLEAFDRLIENVPCYELRFTPDERALPVLESLLQAV